MKQEENGLALEAQDGATVVPLNDGNSDKVENTETNANENGTKSETEAPSKDEATNVDGDKSETKNESETTTKSTIKYATDRDGIKLKYLDLDLFYSVMSVPSYSRNERRMQTFVLHWARQKGIDAKMDKKGNIYLTKGTLSDGEYYPCLTAHMDTVQEKAKAYVDAGARLKINITEQKLYLDKDKEFYGGDVKHKAFVDGMGIGADDKGGVLISLAIMEHFEKIKAVFFVEEEIGMCGSKSMVKQFFDDCGYCIGWDSPDRNRAAYKSSGTKLFSAEFHEKFLKPICDDWGLDDFRSEPFTDIINIRESSNLMCMNFGNGGYDAHMYTEYMILEDTDHALGMGIDLVRRLGLSLYKTPETTRTWGVGDSGVFEKNEEKTTANTDNKLSNPETGDEAYFNRVFNRWSYSGGSYNHNTGGSTNTHTGGSTYDYRTGANNSGGLKKDTDKDKDKVASTAVVKYIAETYDAYLSDVKASLEDVLKKFCEKNGLDYDDELKDSMSHVFSKEIKF